LVGADDGALDRDRRTDLVEYEANSAPRPRCCGATRRSAHATKHFAYDVERDRADERGDDEAALAALSAPIDAWFLDGFSPAKNPGLWTDALMAQVAAHTGKSGTFATYTAAGFVRRALAAAGFAVERRPGFGHKRHMTAGILSA
jgi:tRNA U34 5-methylaminomethyl-2-thiouridine-forming methyltransferase MnmC